MAAPRASTDFDEFYLATVNGVVRQLYALTGDMEDARDIAQEAFAKAWDRWSHVSSYDAPEAWVRTVAHRIAISSWRRNRTKAAAYRRHGPSTATAEPSVDAVLLAKALKTLPDNQRRAIVLHYLADLSVEQIAREIGAPAGSVKAWLSRGRVALASSLGSLEAPVASAARKDAR